MDDFEDMDEDMDLVVLGMEEPPRLNAINAMNGMNANLPVAVPVHDRNDRRRRRQRIMRGDFPDEGEAVNNARLADDMIHDENNEDEEEAAAVFVPWMPDDEESTASAFLLDLVREDLPCSSILSGANIRGCSVIVQRIEDHPEEVAYKCPRTGRTPLHEASWRCCCRHVILAMLETGRNRVRQLDSRSNSPLHLLFLGIATRHIESQDLQSILDQILDPFPLVAMLRNVEGCVPLHCACAAPETMLSPDVIDRLIQVSPASVNRVNVADQTPLHVHCRKRSASVTVARTLLTAAPETLHLRDRSAGLGYTPLHYAAMNANHALIKFLLEHDPTSATGLSLLSLRTPLHLLCQQNAISTEELESIKCLLQASPHTALRTDEDTLFTPLHLVCRGTRGINQAVVEALVQAAPEALLMRDFNDYLPLHHACENGAGQGVIGCMLQAGPQAVSMRTRKNDTALSLACTANKSVEAVRLLLEAYPPASLQPNDYGFIPLHCSCRSYQAQTPIVHLLVRTCPEAVLKKTNAGEAAIHLAGSNTGASVGILDILTKTLKSLREEDIVDADELIRSNPTCPRDRSLTSSVGNTPLHLACFRNFSRPHIESLAASHPEWITVRNNAGYSPLQILCKNGRIDDRIVTLFSRLCGSQVFASVDLMGNTPLHSAMREETDVEALRAIIRAYPEALHSTTTYEDTPLHLACLRRVNPDVVSEIALASSIGLQSALATCNGRISPILMKNTAGQTPIGIAVEEYQKQTRGSSCSLQTDLSYSQMRGFNTLAILTKMLHYGPSQDGNVGQSLVGACVAIHRKGARIDPAYIHRALHLYPEEARVVDEDGNTPLHIEASIPIEKMSLLDASGLGCCDGSCHRRMGVLRKLMEIYPDAANKRNRSGDFPLNLMIQNGRPWDSSFALVVRTYPQAFHWMHSMDIILLPQILTRVSNSCGADTLYTLIRSRPEFLLAR